MLKLISVVLLVWGLNGCVSHTLHQSAQVLPADQSAWGGSIGSDGVGLLARIPFGGGADAGVKIYELPIGVGVNGDLKVQVRRREPIVSADLGFSYAKVPDLWSSTEPSYDDFFSISPALLLGGPKYYGLRCIYVNRLQSANDDYYAVGLLIGDVTKRGRRLVIPEAGIYLVWEGTSELKPKWVCPAAGLAIQFLAK